MYLWVRLVFFNPTAQLRLEGVAVPWCKQSSLFHSRNMAVGLEEL